MPWPPLWFLLIGCLVLFCTIKLLTKFFFTHYLVTLSFVCLVVNVFSWLKPYIAHKLQPRSIPCVFLGYHSSYEGYRCLDMATGRIYISRHVQFHEQSFQLKLHQQLLLHHLLLLYLKSSPFFGLHLLLQVHLVPAHLLFPLQSHSSISPSPSPSPTPATTTADLAVAIPPNSSVPF